MKDLYSVTLSPDQVDTICEQYVLSQASSTGLDAKVLPSEKPRQSLVVSVYRKRVRKAKAA